MDKNLLYLILTIWVSGCGFSSPATPTTDASESTECPSQYVEIPANSTLGTDAFCLAKFEMKVITNAGAEIFDGNNAGVAYDVNLYKPDSRPGGTPWIRITHQNAILECSGLGTGYHLVTAAEWNAMVRNVELVPANWSSLTPGTGTINRGHSDSAASGTAVADGYATAAVAILAVVNENDPYGGTGNAATDSWGSGKEQKRTFELSTGEVIWDIAGNARDRVDIDGQGSTISYTGPGSSSFNDTLSAAVSSTVSSMVLSVGSGSANLNWFTPVSAGINDLTNYIGKYYISSNGRTGRVLTRGGNFQSANSPGIFGGDLDSDAVSASGSAGFRCAYTIP